MYYGEPFCYSTVFAIQDVKFQHWYRWIFKHKGIKKNNKKMCFLKTKHAAGTKLKILK